MALNTEGNCDCGETMSASMTLTCDKQKKKTALKQQKNRWNLRHHTNTIEGGNLINKLAWILKTWREMIVSVSGKIVVRPVLCYVKELFVNAIVSNYHDRRGEEKSDDRGSCRVKLDISIFKWQTDVQTRNFVEKESEMNTSDVIYAKSRASQDIVFLARQFNEPHVAH